MFRLQISVQRHEEYYSEWLCTYYYFKSSNMNSMRHVDEREVQWDLVQPSIRSQCFIIHENESMAKGALSWLASKITVRSLLQYINAHHLQVSLPPLGNAALSCFVIPCFMFVLSPIYELSHPNHTWVMLLIPVHTTYVWTEVKLLDMFQI